MSDSPQRFSHYPTWPLPVLEGGGAERIASGGVGSGPGGGGAEGVLITPRSTCGYFPDRVSIFRAFDADQLLPEEYQRLMDAGFRRSGTLIYQPMCPGCRACVPIRVCTSGFVAGKSERRVMRKNAGLLIRVGPAEPTAEKWELYDRYQREWHDGKQAGDPLSFMQFLYRSPVRTIEFEYRDPEAGFITPGALEQGGKLLGVGICDLTTRALSSVYFYFDPAYARRSLGTFSALYELSWAKERGIPYWYAGYWVRGCRTMEYKARFRPAELLGTDGAWRPMANDTDQ